MGDMSQTSSTESLLLSDTGRWAMSRQATQLSVDCHERWQSRAALGQKLGIRNDAQLHRVWDAVLKVTRERTPVSMTLPGRAGGANRLLIIRPAREPHLVVLIMENVDEAPPAPPAHVLADLFGLTPAECAVAAALLRGDETVEIASARGNSSETVRGYVKSILRKTGFSSQRQLTTMLARIGMLAGRVGAEAR